jgi:acetolactate synthase-1/2/3 large subunit
VAIIGDHATTHREYDAPLSCDIPALTSPICRWTRSVEAPEDAAELGRLAVEESMTAERGIAALLLPADTAWGRARASQAKFDYLEPSFTPVSQQRIDDVKRALAKAKKPAFLLGGHALQAPGLAAASGLAAKGFQIFSETFPARQTRGRSQLNPDRLPYSGPEARSSRADYDLLITVEAADPVAFFAYPGEAGNLAPPTMTIVSLASCGEDGTAALRALGAGQATLDHEPIDVPVDLEARPTPLTAGQLLARFMPEGAIVSDDAVTASGPLWMATTASRDHEWMTLTGGAIGQGLPLAIGAAVACPDRKVLALTGDGAGMYNPQSLWTIMHEQLDVVVLVFANHAYRILEFEYERTGAGARTSSHSMFNLSGPKIDWVAIAQGFGMPAISCQTNGELSAALARAMENKGACLIEILID